MTIQAMGKSTTMVQAISTPWRATAKARARAFTGRPPPRHEASPERPPRRHEASPGGLRVQEAALAAEQPDARIDDRAEQHQQGERGGSGIGDLVEDPRVPPEVDGD